MLYIYFIREKRLNPQGSASPSAPSVSEADKRRLEAQIAHRAQVLVEQKRENDRNDRLVSLLKVLCYSWSLGCVIIPPANQAFCGFFGQGI